MRRPFLLGAMLALALSGFWAWPDQATDTPQLTQEAAAVHAGSSGGSHPPLPEPFMPASSARAPETLRQAIDWIHKESVLRGTQMDGGWSINAQGELHPSKDLRLRFDYLLQLVGQQPVETITQYLQYMAQQELQIQQVQAVMDMWSRYLRLQQTPPGQVLDPSDPSSIRAVVRDMQRLRSQTLGPQWAQAFYADEEAQLMAVANGQVTQPMPEPVTDDATRQGLAQEDMAHADWMAKLEQGKQQLQTLRANANWSAPQKEQAIAQWFNSQFQGHERIRAAAVLGLKIASR